MSTTPRPNRDELLARARAGTTRLALTASFHADALAAALDLRRTDIDCLLLLRLDGPATPGQLGESTGLSSGGVSGVLDRLERAGFVRRQGDPGDRRRVVVSLAGDRAGQLERLLEPLDRAILDAVGTGTESELDALVAFNERHLAALTGATARLRTARADDGTLEPRDGLYTVAAGAAAGTVEFAGASGAFSVRGDTTMTDLLHARIEGPTAVRERDGTVTLGSRHGAGAVEAEGEITLNAGVPWRLRVRGGALRVAADLRAIALAELTVAGGAVELEVALGQPTEAISRPCHRRR